MRKIIIATLAFIALAGSASAELYTPVEYPYAASVLATLKVRSGPSSNESQIGELRRGDKVTITECRGAFCYAERAIGVPGWIHSDYFLATGPVEKPATIIEHRPELSDRIIMRPMPTVKFGF